MTANFNSSSTGAGMSQRGAAKGSPRDQLVKRIGKRSRERRLNPSFGGDLLHCHSLALSVLIGFGACLIPQITRADPCTAWSIDIFDSRTGKKSGQVFSMKDDLASKTLALENQKKTAARLCKYWGPTDSDCFEKYGQPYCADHAQKPSSLRSFTVQLHRRCVMADGSVKGTISVNGKTMGDVTENIQTLISPGIYGGHMRSSSSKENVQGPFGTMGKSGGDFLLEVDGVVCSDGTPRTGLLLHPGTKATDSHGCVLLGPAGRATGTRFIPDTDTNLLSRLRQEFYGTNLPDSTPNRDIRFEFGQPSTHPSCN